MQAVLESPYLPQQLIRCGTAGAGFVGVRLVVQVHVLACREMFQGHRVMGMEIAADPAVSDGPEAQAVHISMEFVWMDEFYSGRS